MTQPVPSNVKEAALALDKEYPGWENKVNLETLNMVDGNVCLMGQLFPEIGYRAGIVKVFGEFVRDIFSGSENKWKQEILDRRHNFQDDDLFCLGEGCMTFSWQFLKEHPALIDNRSVFYKLEKIAISTVSTQLNKAVVEAAKQKEIETLQSQRDQIDARLKELLNDSGTCK